MYYFIHTATDSQGIFDYIVEDWFETLEEAEAAKAESGDWVDNPCIVEANNQDTAIKIAKENDNYEEPKDDLMLFDRSDFIITKKGAAGYRFDKDDKEVVAWFAPWEFTAHNGKIFIDTELHEKKIAGAK